MAKARRKQITEKERQRAHPTDMPGSPNGPRPKLTTSKKILFSAVTCLSFFALLELVLWAAGVPTLIEQEDPFRGFSGRVKVF